MRNRKYIFIFILLVFLFAGSFMVHTVRAETVHVNFLNVVENGVVELGVGETVTFMVEVIADEAFTSALMLSDEQFPGKGIKLSGADIQTRSDYALLALSATGKASTADLPNGVAPVSLVVGVRYPGGYVLAERVNFFVRVP